MLINYGHTHAVYGTDEVQVGVWMDGRPVYRRMFELSAMSAGQKRTIEVDLGGGNLLTGSRAFGGEWRNSALWTEDGEFKGWTVRTYAGVWDGIAQAVYVEPGVYTFSGWVKGAGGASVNAYGTHDGSAAFAPTGAVLGAAGEEFVRLSYTFEVTEAGYVRPRFENIVQGGQLWVCGLKLEAGAAATAWIPAAADGDGLETPTILDKVVSLRGMAKLSQWDGMWVFLPNSDYDSTWAMPLIITGADRTPLSIGVYNNQNCAMVGGYVLIEYTKKE